MNETVNKLIRRKSKSQMLICILLAALGGSCISIENMLVNFLTPYQDHWCHVKEVSHCSADVQKSLIVPWDEELNEYDHCSKRNITYSSVSSCKKQDNTSMQDEYEKCSSGFVFDESVFNQTVTSRFSLVCEDAWILDIISPIYVCGLIVGSVLSGIIADRIGRKACLMLSVCLHVFSGIFSSFMPNVWAFAFGRLLMGISIRGIGLSSSTLMIEIFPSEKIQFASYIFACCYNLGPYLLVLVAYFIRNYQWLQLTMSLPFGIMLFCWWIVPESPTWLLSQGRYEDTIKELRRMSKLNAEDDETVELIRKETCQNHKTKSEKFNCEIILKYKRVLFYLYAFSILNITVALTYLSFSFNIGLLFGDIYSNIAIGTSLDVLAVIIISFFIQKIKRKFFILTFLILLTCMQITAIILILLNVNQMVVTIATLLIRMLCQGMTPMLFPYQGEVFPTSMRQQSYGVTYAISGCFVLAAPSLAGRLRLVWPPAPYIIFVFVNVIAFISSLSLPETRGKGLPHNFDDILKKNSDEPMINQDLIS